MLCQRADRKEPYALTFEADIPGSFMPLEKIIEDAKRVNFYDSTLECSSSGAIMANGRPIKLTVIMVFLSS